MGKRQFYYHSKPKIILYSRGTSNLRGGHTWFDKVNLKTSGWVEDEWTKEILDLFQVQS